MSTCDNKKSDFRATHTQKFFKSFPKIFTVSRCANTDRQTHTRERAHAHARACRPWDPTQGPVAPANTLEKQNRLPVLFLQSVAGRKAGKCRQKASQLGPRPTDTRETQEAGRLHLLRGPHGGRRSLQPAPRLRARGRSPAPLSGLGCIQRNHRRLPAPPASRGRPPRSDVRRLGAGYLWQGYSEFSLGRVLIAVPWDL